MTNLVPSTEIERIVGYKRQENTHLGRIVSSEEVFYVLHSQECKDTTPDLRDCAYSKAVDLGLFDLPRWKGFEDMAVSLVLNKDGKLSPVRRMGGLNVN